MRTKTLAGLAVLIILAYTLVACSTSPTGRQQLTLFPSAELNRMGIAAFDEMREETPVSTDAATNRYVTCITDALLAQVEGRDRGLDWEMVVFEDDAVNAFALPGGKMGVYTGLLDVAENQHQLAAVIGHEIGHVLAEHGNERMSTQFATGAGLQIAAIIGADGSPQRSAALAALGLGAQVGVLLPFSRAHEREADLIGLDLMAKAGFQPEESVQLWRNMSAASGNGGPPEFLSTHPSGDTRINQLQNAMPDAKREFERARQAGRQPNCQRP